MRLQIIRLYCNNSNQKQNNNKCQGECKKYHMCRKDYIWNPSMCIYENSTLSDLSESR